MIGLAADPCRERQARTAPAGAPCADRAKPWVVATAILGSSMAFIDGTVVVVALAPMRESLGASLSEMQWVVNAYALILAAFLLIGGAAGDALGLRRMFALGVGIFGAASLWCGLAGSAAGLIAARALQGIGAALLVPGSLALISAHFPQAERGRAIGTWAAASAIAAAIGPVLGGWLLDLGDWHLIFLINVPLAALTLVLALRRVPVRPAPVLRRMDWTGGALAVVGLGGIVFGATALGDPGAAGGRLPAMLAMVAGVLVLAVFIRHEARAAVAMLPLRLFRDRTFAAANLLTLLLYFALTGALFFVPMVLMEAHGYAAAEAGAVFLPFTATMAVVSRLAGRWADRAGVRLPLGAGSLLAAAAMALLGPALASGAFWSAVAPVMLLLGVGIGIVVAPLSTAVMNAVPDAQAGIASAVNNAVSRVAGLLAVAMLGAVASFGFAAYLGRTDAPGDTAAGLARAGFGAPLPIEAAGDAALQALRADATVAGGAAVTTVCAVTALAASVLGLAVLARGPQPARAGGGAA